MTGPRAAGARGVGTRRFACWWLPGRGVVSSVSRRVAAETHRAVEARARSPRRASGPRAWRLRLRRRRASRSSRRPVEALRAGRRLEGARWRRCGGLAPTGPPFLRESGLPVDARASCASHAQVEGCDRSSRSATAPACPGCRRRGLRRAAGLILPRTCAGCRREGPARHDPSADSCHLELATDRDRPLARIFQGAGRCGSGPIDRRFMEKYR
jgi:hypothetical protein